MNNFMKLIAAACFVSAIGISCAAAATCVNCNATEFTDSDQSAGRPVSGMFFSTEYVVEEYEYDDAYCLLYDDADADMFNVEICVDLETYKMVRAAIAEKRELVGMLVLNKDCSNSEIEVYTYQPDPEFEMAAASAKM